MRYLVLASDYDGTLATDGVVDDETVRAVERLVHSGRKLILVTGRELPDLESVFSRLDLFLSVSSRKTARCSTIRLRAKSELSLSARRSVSSTIFENAVCRT